MDIDTFVKNNKLLDRSSESDVIFTSDVWLSNVFKFLNTIYP